jgi:membrane-bound lytic murein transglycosylase B
MIKELLTGLTLAIGLVVSPPNIAAIKTSPIVNTFINNMVKKHGFKQSELEKLLQATETKQSILTAIARPAEARMPWHQYRLLFLTPARILGGLKFWKKNKTVLLDIEKKQGVPWQIIVAIIGIETQYGGNTGSFRVIDALATLAFSYPKRSPFFTDELEHFLLLCREEKINPLKPKGSYAGAMGLPQFMPSSYRNYAVDYEKDQRRNIWSNPADAIASVSNYLVNYGWKRGRGIAYPVSATGLDYTQTLSDDLKLNSTLAKLKALNVNIPNNIPLNRPAKLLDYQQPASKELWVGLNNFYVITRYNHSRLYALAVYQLSMEILAKVKETQVKKIN